MIADTSNQPHISRSAYSILNRSPRTSLMNNNTNATGAKATKDRSSSTWTRDNEATLVHALKAAKEDGKWGDNNPKEQTWTACVEALSGSEEKSGGKPKNVDAVKRRWQRVCAHRISCIVCVFTIPSSAETRI